MNQFKKHVIAGAKALRAYGKSSKTWAEGVREAERRYQKERSKQKRTPREQENWPEGDQLARAFARAGLDPAEIERVLHEDPRVASCAVVGVADERLGERVMAAVQLARGVDASEDELKKQKILK